MSLTDFLLARIAEDETVARGAIAHGEGSLDWADDGDPTDKHISRHDPARTLAECEARRRIVETYTATYYDTSRKTPWGGCGDDCEWKALEWAIALLALPYADRPDYDPAWRT